MANIETTAVINGVLLKEQTGTPSTPASGKSLAFAKADGMYIIDDSGVVTGPFGNKATMYGAIKLGGDASNYVNIAADGMLTLIGTAKVWDDVRIEPTVRSSGINVPAFEQYFTNGAGSRGVYLYSFTDAVANNENELHFTAQMPHAWAQTAIHIHVHFIPATTVNSSAVRWGLEYTWVEPNAAFGNSTIIYASVAEGAPANMVAATHYITEFTALTPTSSQDGFSSVMIGRLFRNSSHTDDTYTDKVGLLYIDAHIELNKLGSNDEYT